MYEHKLFINISMSIFLLTCLTVIGSIAQEDMSGNLVKLIFN